MVDVCVDEDVCVCVEDDDDEVCVCGVEATSA